MSNKVNQGMGIALGCLLGASVVAAGFIAFLCWIFGGGWGPF